MRLATVKLFDSSNLDPETATKLEPLILYINQQFDSIITALQRNLTFGDNLRAELKVVELASYEPKRLAVTQGQQVLGVFVVRPPSDRLVTGFSYKVVSSGTLEATVAYSAPGKAEVTLVVLYA